MAAAISLCALLAVVLVIAGGLGGSSVTPQIVGGRLAGATGASSASGASGATGASSASGASGATAATGATPPG